MQTHNTILVNLILDHLHEELTPEKQEQLTALLAASPQKQQLFNQVNDPEWVQQELGKLNSINAEAAWQKFSAGITVEPVEKIIEMPVKRMNWLKWAAAAVVVLAIGIGIYWFNQQPEPTGIASVVPASNDATLTINDSTYTLAPGSTRTLLNIPGLEVIKQDTSLWYRADNSSFIDKGAQPLVNTLKTKNGRKYLLQLEDGTKVWLDPGTAISYTAPFSPTERSVQVTGEAYFEVTKDARPFRVYLQDSTGARGTIEVLGTRFNVNAYSGAPIKTTLLEGKLQLSQAGKNPVTLTSGQRATIDNEAGIHIDSDLQKITGTSSWRQAEFVFEEDDIPFVMAELARWYNFKVDIRGKFTVPLSTSFPRNTPINEVLNILKKHANIRSTITGDTIIVVPG